MLTIEQLQTLIHDTESDRVERTVATKKTDKYCEAICAFANDFPNSKAPGYLLVGVDDGGIVAGLRISDEVLLDLASLRSNTNLEPLPALTVQKLTLPDGEVAMVEVLPSDLPPVRYKGQVWIRIGPSRRRANRQEEQLLVEKRTAYQRTYDVRACDGCTLSELAVELFLVGYLPAAVARDVLEENDRSTEHKLASLRFYDLRAGCATNAGVLFFGKDPLRWVPGAYVQYVRWAGCSMTAEPIDEKRFTGDLLTVLRDIQNFLALPSQVHPVGETLLRERAEMDYPPAALRELLMNAIMHRSYESNAPVRFYWYDDRVEIQNPGGLYGMASPENFPTQTDYRNPVVASAMATLGYVNAFGRGVIRAQDALVKNGNPRAEFVFETSHVMVTIRRKP